MDDFSLKDIVAFSARPIQSGVISGLILGGILYIVKFVGKVNLWSQFVRVIQWITLLIFGVKKMFFTLFKNILREVVRDLMNEPKVVFRSDFSDRDKWILNYQETTNKHRFTWDGKLSMQGDGQHRDSAIRPISPKLFEFDKTYQVSCIARSRMFNKTFLAVKMSSLDVSSSPGDTQLSWRYTKISFYWTNPNVYNTKVISLECPLGDAIIKKIFIEEHKPNIA